MAREVLEWIAAISVVVGNCQLLLASVDNSSLSDPQPGDTLPVNIYKQTKKFSGDRSLPSSFRDDHLRPHVVEFQPQFPLVQKHFDAFHALFKERGRDGNHRRIRQKANPPGNEGGGTLSRPPPPKLQILRRWKKVGAKTGAVC